MLSGTGRLVRAGAPRALAAAGLLLVLGLAAPAPGADLDGSMYAEKRLALVIGNSRYENAPLRNPVNDARVLARTLAERGFEVTKLEDASDEQMKRAIDAFGRSLRLGAVGFFFYAGHALQIDGRNYLIPVGAVIDVEQDVEYEAVDVGRVLGKMEAAGNRMNIVVLDACRNNPFARSTRSAVKGLATVDAPKGTFIAYATAPGSVARDGEGDNGVFTEAFVQALAVEGLKIEEVFKAVRTEVRKRSDGQQIPWQSSSIEGDFYFSLPKRDEQAPVKHKVLPTF
jgi:uncharacterized caspase-like protein